MAQLNLIESLGLEFGYASMGLRMVFFSLLPLVFAVSSQQWLTEAFNERKRRQNKESGEAGEAGPAEITDSLTPQVT